MSLFSKTEVKPEMESFIAKGEGVGVVNVNNYGDASARIESHKIILESYKDEYPIIESISAITLLSYDPGNFFQEPKLVIGFRQKEYTLAGVDNNDDELEAFYKSILNLKNQEKSQKTNTTSDESLTITNKSDNEQNEYDELDELDEELGNKNTINDTTNKIKGFLSKRFTVPVEKELGPNKSNKTSFINNKVDDLQDMLEQEEEVELIEKESNKKSEIEDIQEYDEFDEFDEIDDFEVDEEIILENDLDTGNTIDGGIIIEEDDEDDEIILEDEDETTLEEDNSQKQEETPSEASNEPDNNQNNNKPQNNEERIEEQVQEKPAQNETETDEIQQEISEAKEQVTENINDLNQEISNQQTASTSTSNNFDPVYQIRRYYELKEDGIITEEEFEMKKKQLLDL